MPTPGTQVKLLCWSERLSVGSWKYKPLYQMLDAKPQPLNCNPTYIGIPLFIKYKFSGLLNFFLIFVGNLFQIWNVARMVMDSACTDLSLHCTNKQILMKIFIYFLFIFYNMKVNILRCKKCGRNYTQKSQVHYILWNHV